MPTGRDAHGVDGCWEIRVPSFNGQLRFRDRKGGRAESTDCILQVSSPYYLDHVAIGSYGAIANGVFVSSSVGNDGPNEMSVTSLAQWLTIAGAGTIDLNFTAHGKIVVCDRGSGALVVKGLVVQKACGIGMILANGMSNAEGPVGDAHVIPTAALGANEGDAVKSYISSTANPTATIDFRAWTNAVGPTGLASDKRRTEFNILSPSMAWPHVSEAAQLLKSEHPDWIPAVNLPAMMTAASPVLRAQELHEKLITFSTWNQPLFLHLAHVLPCTVCLSSPAEASNKQGKGLKKDGIFVRHATDQNLDQFILGSFNRKLKYI
ncbi:hypothetical protein NL676_015715 [Syzygium grande]|nr:hypothetical protein NL676_015715 [Syzygium grande]